MELPEWLKSREQSMSLGEAVSIAEMMDWDDDKCAPVFLCKPEEAYLAFKKLAEHAREVPRVRKLTHDPANAWGRFDVNLNDKPLYEKYINANEPLLSKYAEWDANVTRSYYNEVKSVNHIEYEFEATDAYKHAMEALKDMPPVWPKLKKPND